jgi:hypothetical protein
MQNHQQALRALPSEKYAIPGVLGGFLPEPSGVEILKTALQADLDP